MKFDNFDAKIAREISDSGDNEELQKVLKNIKAKAEQGEYSCYVYKPLKPQVLKKIEERGFLVKHLDSIAIQKESLYYHISW